MTRSLKLILLPSPIKPFAGVSEKDDDLGNELHLVKVEPVPLTVDADGYGEDGLDFERRFIGYQQKLQKVAAAASESHLHKSLG